MKIRALILCALLMASCAQAADKSGLEILRADGKIVRFDVERATTDETRAKGLMFRAALAAGEGMIFLYDQPGDVSFWMKNTLIPLDMIFFDEKGEITHIEASARPESLDARGPNRGDTCAVLEIGGGQAALHGLKAGDKMVLSGPSACLP